MNNTKTQIRFVLPTVLVAFIAGYFFKWLIRDHAVAGNAPAIWLGVLTIIAIVCAFVLGERQIHALWKHSLETDAQSAARKRASFLALATTAHDAIVRLDDLYKNTHEDRMRIRAVYHGDTFASLIEALTAIRAHEPGSVEAAIAFAGLRKNMIDAQRLIDPFIAAKSRPNEDVLFPHMAKGLDLRICRIFAEAHYQTLVHTLKP